MCPIKYDSEFGKCDRCESPANHLIGGGDIVGTNRLCCKHYIEDGGTPSDWHYGCMAAFKLMKGKNNVKKI